MEQLSLVETSRAIREGRLSAEEVVGACLSQIEAVNPHLNAVVQLAAEQALERARQADVAKSRGETLPPLHGVPFTIKDSYDTVGIVSTWGTVGRKHHVPAADATVVSRLKEAGAILLGKTNTPEFTLSYETDNRIYGRTNNPYDLARTPGGSSGGSAAIVAAGGVPFDIGSDTGGSVRLPAHFCGIAGLKPTSGRIPRTGHAIGPGSLIDDATQPGPLAREVADLALLLPILAGPDGRDPTVAPVPLGDPSAVKPEELRVAYFEDNGIQRPVGAIRSAVRAAADALANAGVRLEEARPPGIEGSQELASNLFRGWDGGAWVRMMLERAGTEENESTLDRYLVAKEQPADWLVALIDRWDHFKMTMLLFMQQFDAILCPANAYVALPHGSFVEHYPGFSYTMTFNLTGWPAAVVRVGSSEEGLPVGVQVAAGPWREEVTLALAGILERELGGWQPVPSSSLELQ